MLPCNARMGFGLIPLLDAFTRRAFSSAGLRSESIDVDSDTTIRCWLPQSLLLSNLQGPNPEAYSTKHNSNEHNTKPVLVLIHGFGPAAAWQWRSQVRVLARHFDLIVPELVFFGKSTTRSAERSERFQAAVLAKLLAALGLHGGVFGVVGTSYGGFVAYHLARMMGEKRIRKVVIASSDLGKGEEDDRTLRERAGGVESVEDLMLPRTTDNLRKLIRLAFRRAPPFMPDFVLREVLRSLYKDNLDQKMELIKGVTVGKKDLFQLCPLPQDVLIIWGEYDGIFSLDKAFVLKEKLGENAKLEVLKNTGHMPQYEDPDGFNKVLLNFLIGVSKSSL